MLHFASQEVWRWCR